MKFITLFIFLVLLPAGLAEDHDDDLEIFGLEAEKLLHFGSGILAAVLCAFTFAAYHRTKRSRLKFVAVAFFLFAVKLFLMATELFIDELPFIDPVAAGLDFAILLSFFTGMVKK